jgi:hypothetical protein
LADILNTDIETLSTTPPDNGWYKNTKLFADNFQYFYGNDEYSTTSAVTLQKDKLLPRTTWLSHFTDHPDKIATQGFVKGVDDMTRLAATTHFSDNSKTSGGYNFAFIADSRFARENFKDNHYGKHIVFFQSSGVQTWHDGNNITQIIFWGKDIPHNTIVPVYNDDGDLVVKNWKTDREIFRTDSYVKMQEWIEKNYHQYKSTICCNG